MKNIDFHSTIESAAKKAIDICPLVKTKRDRSVAYGVMKLFEEIFDAKMTLEFAEKPDEVVTSGYIEVEEITGNEAVLMENEPILEKSVASVRTTRSRKKK